jgi:hypothetical protein
LMLYFFFFCLALLGIKHRSYCMLGMWWTTELHHRLPPPLFPKVFALGLFTL